MVVGRPATSSLPIRRRYCQRQTLPLDGQLIAELIYAGTHIPLAQKIPTVRRFEAGKVLGGADGSAAPYYFIAELWFDTTDDLQASFQSPEGKAAAEDVGTFASGGATLMIAEA